MTRSDALAHLESLERGADPNHAKVVVVTFWLQTFIISQLQNDINP